MTLRFDRQGLIPAVIQDDESNEVLMVAFMNEEALRLTRETGYTHFYSRSRQKIWRKGEQSGHRQQVRAIFVNCEENSLLIRVVQEGGAACHEGYRSCYYRRLLPDDRYEVVATRVFDPAAVYGHPTPQTQSAGVIAAGAAPVMDLRQSEPEADEAISRQLETLLRQLYTAYQYLRDHDLSEQSHTSRLLQEHNPAYLLGRLADELQELMGVLQGTHRHRDLQADTILEGSQVGYWLLLLATTHRLPYEEFLPHQALLAGYRQAVGEEQAVEQQQACLSALATAEPPRLIEGLRLGFALIGRACALAGLSPLEPARDDLEQMRRKGLVS
ncbi:MAG: phosphoribosyl-AMP cyclohydrolase [Thermogemmatispora sp.]|uniref:phosphoribosyl-AMP cyclohydrolase n=1 Tax=Thermogemmatispora sp. TaxID=1968838 RepID=UPI00260177FA|nr:phosphoribosyl-AMP cyclohydrolase [Thermogemmatispora sp.]MBX5456669.1 phosphoribosyl-AMP cyclohydrolase [Thermogemmatispora sp.]